MYLYRQAERAVCGMAILGFDPRDWLPCFFDKNERMPWHNKLRSTP